MYIEIGVKNVSKVVFGGTMRVYLESKTVLRVCHTPAISASLGLTLVNRGPLFLV